MDESEYWTTQRHWRPVIFLPSVVRSDRSEKTNSNLFCCVVVSGLCAMQ